jgi:putative ABC transport system permease protein
MFINYLKIAFRSLLKNKRYSVVSIGGLAVGLAGFILILMYVDHEFSYDKWLPDHQQIYRAEFDANFNGKDAFRGPLLPDGIAKAGVAAVPEIKAGTRLANREMILKNNAKQINVKHVYRADSSFFDVFQYPFLYGNPKTALDDPNTIVLTKGLSERLFGNENPVGRSLYLVDGKKTITVTGVLKENNQPTSLEFDALVSYNYFTESWFNNHTVIYFLLKRNADPIVVQNKLTKVLQSKAATYFEQVNGMTIQQWLQSGRKWGIHIQPISDLHLHPFWDPGSSKVISITVIGIFLLGLLILIVAAINFMNMATAQASSRAKEVGVKKVMGSSHIALSWQFLTEYLIQCLIALLIALIIAKFCLPLFNRTLNIQLTMFTKYNFLRHGIQIVLAIFGVTLLSGLYPALFLSGYQPAKVLKGNFSRGSKGSGLKKSLLTIQLFIAVLFLIGTAVIFLQIKYLQKRDLGFRPDQVITFQLRGKSFEDYNSFKNRVAAVPGVKDVSRSMSPLTNFNAINKITYKGENYSSPTEQVGFDYFKTLGIPIDAGRVFSPEYSTDSADAAVLNETAVRTMHLKSPIGAIVSFNKSKFHIIGVVKDFQFAGVDKAIPPMFFFMQREPAWSERRGTAFVKINGGQMKPALSQIEKIWHEYDPSYDFHFQYANKIYAQVLNKYTQQGKIFLTFALLNILLALIGLYALAAFLSKSKTKEIGIRKVLGASNNDILKMLNKDFVWLVLIASLIAWPVTYLLAKEWLNSFPYRIDIAINPFVIATVILLLITMLTVSIQAWRAANANPVEALKYE